jgi:hypothetical protein
MCYFFPGAFNICITLPYILVHQCQWCMLYSTSERLKPKHEFFCIFSTSSHANFQVLMKNSLLPFRNLPFYLPFALYTFFSLFVLTYYSLLPPTLFHISQATLFNKDSQHDEISLWFFLTAFNTFSKH